MTINCPKCNVELDLPPQAMGRKVQCPYCGEKFVGKTAGDGPNITPPNQGPCFKCGKCGAIVPLNQQRLINVTDDPTLKKQVLNGQLFTQVCTHCGAGGRIAFPCIYVDNDTSLFVDFCTSLDAAIGDEDTKSKIDYGGWDEQWRQDGSHNVRVAVVGLNELTEIIRITDAKLDPYIIAMCKKYMVENMTLEDCDHLYFDHADEDKIHLSWFESKSHKGHVVWLGRSGYDYFKADLEQRDYEPLRMCEYIDYMKIDELISRCASKDPVGPQFKAMKQATIDNPRNAVAWHDLGLAYHFGHQVSKNEYKAFRCFRESAELHDSDGQVCLGNAYLYGQGCTPSYFRAHTWFDAAAEQGNPNGMECLGFMAQYCDQYKDINAAIEWYEKAAAKGCPSSFYYLGELFSAGKDIARDVEKARSYYQKALAGGEERAREGLQKL